MNYYMFIWIGDVAQKIPHHNFLESSYDWDPSKDKDSDQKIIDLFYNIETLSIEELINKENVSNYVPRRANVRSSKGGGSCKSL